MTITEKFFVECVKKGIKGEKIDCVPDGLDYKQLYNLCIAHSMSVAVFRALENCQNGGIEQFITALKRSVNRHVMRDVQSEFDISTVLSEFEKRGLKYMPLKGYHLKKLYPTTDMRYASDCDVLIDVDQLKDVRSAVKDLGLMVKRYDEHHDIVYYPQTKTVFELHKSIFVGKLESYFGKGNKGFNRAHVKEGYQYFYQMDKEIFYISLLAHSAYHFAESAGVGIRHLTDVYLYRKTYKLNEEYLKEELKKCGLLKFKEEFEKVAFYLLDDAIADEFTKKIAKHVLESSVLANEEKKTASTIVANAHGEDEKKAKKRSFWRKVFLPTEQMKFLFPVLKKAIWLLPLFHLIRWFKVLFMRPKAIVQLKRMKETNSADLIHMKEIRYGLGINDL